MRVSSTRDLGFEVRRARRARKMTQAELAERAGLRRTWVSRLEAGRENPTFGNLLAVLDALQLDLDLTLRGKGSAPPSLEDLSPADRQGGSVWRADLDEILDQLRTTTDPLTDEESGRP